VNPVAQLRGVNDHGRHYEAIMLWCPGCEVTRDGEAQGGLHMLAVAGEVGHRPRWDFDGKLDAPTLSPSILTRYTMAGEPFVCHSFLRAGVWEFLSDCTHPLVGQRVSAVPLPDWVVAER